MKIGCVILAGGKSSRMGEDKALLEFEGKNFIEHIAGELSFFEERFVACGNKRELLMKEKCKWKMIPDIFPEHGPIGGLHAALKACESESLFCVSCDVPFFTKELAKKMCKEMEAFEETDAVIAITSDGRYHPLCGVYRKELWTFMEELIIQDNNRLMNIFEKCKVRYIKLNKNISGQLTNINTRTDYENLQK